MGLLGDWMKSKNMNDPVSGTLQVTASSHPPDDATSGNFSINGVVAADGLPPTAVEHSGIAKVRKWPHGGQTLPVTVDRADPTRIRIEWDEVPDSWDVARDGAESLAAMMRGGAPGGATMDGGSREQILAALAERGINVPPGAQIHVASAGGAGSEDPAERMRKLQGLKEAGLITDAEYASKRAEILGDV